MAVFQGNFVFPFSVGRLLCVLIACGFLWACGDLSSGEGLDSGKAQAESAQAADGKTTIAPMKMPPGFENRPSQPGETGRERDSQGFPVMKPALGMKTNTMLFSEKMGDSSARFARLENAVQEMRNDYDAMLPSILRLVAIEKDINQLVVQLDSLLKSDPQTLSAPAVSAPVSSVDTEILSDVSHDDAAHPAQVDTLPPVAERPLALTKNDTDSHKSAAVPLPTPPPVSPPAPPAAAAQPQAAAASGITAKGPRFGTHAGYTRIVFDLSGATEFTAEIDEAEKILLVELPQAGWSGGASGTPSHPLVQSWNVSPGAGGKGSLISFQLNRAAKLKGRMALQDPPRIVVDLQD